MWQMASRRAEVPVRIMSIDTMAARPTDKVAGDLVIVDEAHNLRNPLTQRHRAVAQLARGAPLLLLTATPVHNSERDLRALLMLFLGAAADDLDDAALGDIVIRRERVTDAASLPGVIHRSTDSLPDRSDILDEILSLPPPVPASDAGEAAALVSFSLIRQWTSSWAAFAAALARRASLGQSMLVALENGVYPRAADLRSWCTGTDAIQLPLFALWRDSQSPAQQMEPLHAAVERHVEAVCRLLNDSRNWGPEIDSRRWETILRIRREHAGEKVIVFTQFSETARAMFRRSLRQGHAALLTGSDARVASGAIPRQEIINSFAPRSNHRAAVADHMKIDLLFCTDVLSEGANLQDASVVIHLDLPWTPARLAQRVGRVVRPGAARDNVSVYSMPAPASTAAVLRMERRLAAKLSVASRTVGVSGTVLPLLHMTAATGTSIPSSDARMRELLRQFPDPAFGESEDGVAAAVQCHSDASFLTLVSVEDTPRILLKRGDTMMDDPAVIASLLAQLARIPRWHGVITEAPAPPEMRTVFDAIQRWSAERGARSTAGLRSAAYARVRRRLIRRLDSIGNKALPHEKPRIREIAARARLVAAAPFGSGAERVLAELASAPMPDEAWLHAVESFSSTQRKASDTANPDQQVVVLAVLIIRPPGSGA
jgi:hypothetical protein